MYTILFLNQWLYKNLLNSTQIDRQMILTPRDCLTRLDFNPNCTGRGQNGPRWLWHQIERKLILHLIFLKYLFPQKCLANIFFLLHTQHQKKHFDVHFSNIKSKAWPWHPPPPLCPPFCLVLVLFQTIRRGEKSRGHVVCNLAQASQHSSQFLVLGHSVCRGPRSSVGFPLYLLLSSKF